MTLDFTLDADQMAVRTQARQFAEGVLSGVEAAIAPLAKPEERFYALRPFFQQMVDAGFVKALIPAEYGGAPFSSLQFVLAVEEIARVDVNVASAVLGTGLGLYPIVHFGSEEQKKRFLPPFCGSDPKLAAIAYTEVTGGANYDNPDPKVGLQTFARIEGEEIVLNGAKHYTTNASGWEGKGADLISVVCRTDPAKPPQESLAIVVVERGTPGVEITGMIDTIGHRATNSPRVEFKDVRVPLANMIGQPGDGMKMVKGAFSWTCAPIGAACVGRMRAAFEYAYEFAKTDNRGGPHPVIEYQNAGYMLADIKMRIEAARYLSWKAADHFDKTGGLDRELANITKVYASELSVQTVYDAMRLVGVDGYGDKTPIAAIMQDVLCFPVYDGGNMGVRRRQLHEMFMEPSYDHLALAENRLSTGN
ncbi:acyl-CoA dehydrogenase family protein [Pseudonocardia petroleophila]|uniref:Acyl-CoA/acyl-ACP dehydrogenase n=1 Tax=Pseudonocardia petroleophila TaxID=37331 RepID=A0A7G7MIL7_9PSEU|nr:acyl-CoA dehydrogenase family protein [Pseudonocardia petroleophila]QNG52628.1 acyl-CoA/acyl-ACP dehydrogenase [Pseudonocardia petroleophila]